MIPSYITGVPNGQEQGCVRLAISAEQREEADDKEGRFKLTSFPSSLLLPFSSPLTRPRSRLKERSSPSISEEPTCAFS